MTTRTMNVKNPQAVDGLFRLNPITRLTTSLLMGVSAWKMMATPQLQSVRSLHLSMAFPETADAAFASPFLERVVRLDLDTNPLVRWLDQVAAGPLLLAATIVGLVTTIARVA